MTDCVFCPDNWDNLNITERDGEAIAILVPLDPVTSGHRLVISKVHTANAADLDADPTVAGELMDAAARYLHRNKLQANIITSIGPAATQTVMHTHLHIVPRHTDDGLPLPWTPQHEVKSLQAAVVMKRILQESGGDGGSVGLFQRQSITGWGL